MKSIGLSTLALCLVAVVVVMPVSASAGASESVASTVVIDAGHGGKDPGTRSRNGVLEKDVNLAIALDVAAQLRVRGINVLLTRDNDVFVSLDQRVEIANQCGADLFVSIHCDSNASKSVTGFSVIMPRSGAEQASEAARGLSEDLQAAGARRHTLRRDNRGLRVLDRTHSPAVLVEVGFLSNSSEASALNTTARQKTIATSLAEGINEYLHN